MTHGFKAGGGIQGAGGNVNVIAAARIPKQAGTALLTEATVYIGSFIGDGTKPFEAPIFLEHHIFAPGGGIGRYVPVGAPALTAVALNHISQRTSYFILHRPAEATAGGSGSLITF